METIGDPVCAALRGRAEGGARIVDRLRLRDA
jgi:hypothetical protein